MQKTNFADERVETDFDKSEPRSGIIEVFATAKEAVDRATLLHEGKEDIYSYRIIFLYVYQKIIQKNKRKRLPGLSGEKSIA